MDAAHAGAHLGPELEQLEANGGDGGIGELAVAQTDAAQGVDKNIGHGGEPQAELIGLHGGRRGAMGEQLEPLARAESELSLAGNAAQHRDWSYRVAAARAYLALARGGRHVLARFQALPDTLCMGCYVDRLTKARLFDSLGMRADAEVVLKERPHTMITPLEVVAANERSAVAEKLQHYDLAARAYEFVARAWSSGDPMQRARATQAAAKAGQLAGDQPQRGRLAPVR